MLLVKISNGVVEEYPYSLEKLREENPNISFPQDIPDDTLSEYNVFKVAASLRPDHNLLINTVVENNPVKINEVWTQTWTVIELSETESNDAKTAIRLDYDNYLSNQFDFKAKEKGYSSRVTCAMRTGYSGPYQQECIQFAQWMDTSTSQFHQILETNLSTNTYIRPEDIFNQLPTFTWPI